MGHTGKKAQCSPSDLQVSRKKRTNKRLKPIGSWFTGENLKRLFSVIKREFKSRH